MSDEDLRETPFFFPRNFAISTSRVRNEITQKGAITVSLGESIKVYRMWCSMVKPTRLQWLRCSTFFEWS